MSKSKEHIVPESMGCPNGFYLEPSVVCDECNNNVLSRLDSDLQNFFGLLRPFCVKENKKGNPLTARSKFYYAENNNGHVSVFLNAKGKPVKIKEGVVLRSFEDNNKIIHSFHEKVNGSEAEIMFSQDLVVNKKVKRALYKIALEYYCWVNGIETTLDIKFDSVREYVLKGMGERKILMGNKCQFSEVDGIHQFGSISTDNNGNLIVAFLLFNITFALLLFGPGEKLAEMKEQIEKKLSFKFKMA